MAEFGITSLTGYTSNPNSLDDYIIAPNPVSPSSDGVATSISHYCVESTAGTKLTYALYNSDKTLLAQTEEITISAVEGWQTATFSNPPLIYAANTYYIAIWFDTGVITSFTKTIQNSFSIKSITYLIVGCHFSPSIALIAISILSSWI